MGNCCNRDDHPQEEELPPRRRYGRPCRQGQRHEMYPLADGSVLTVGSAGTYNGPSPDTDEWEHEDWDDAEDAEARYRREQEEERREFELVKQRTEALLARSRRRLAAKEEEFRRLTDAGDNSSVSSTRRGSLDQRGAWDLDAVQKCIASSAECSVGEAPLTRLLNTPKGDARRCLGPVGIQASPVAGAERRKKIRRRSKDV